MYFVYPPLQGPVQAPLQGPWAAEYVDYVDNFDPTPYYAFDDYSSCPEYESFWEEHMYELEVQDQLMAEVGITTVIGPAGSDYPQAFTGSF